MGAKVLMTAEEFALLPEDELDRYELVRGELRAMPPPTFEHGGVSTNVIIPLGHYVRQHGLGFVVSEVNFLLGKDPDQVRRADVAFVRADRIPPENERDRAQYQGAPDLAIEIVSPSDSFGAVDRKAREWLGAGARAVWVLQLKSRSVTLYRPGDEPLTLGLGDVLEGGDVVPGFSVPVRELFY